MVETKVDLHVEWINEPLKPVELYKLLYKHKLLPEGLESPQALIAFSRMTRTGLIGCGGDIYAVVVEVVSEPAILNLIMVPKVPMLVRYSLELHGLIPELRKRWFEDGGFQRVEARIPTSRNQAIRSMLALGFTQETAPEGLRHAGRYHKRWESMAVLGLLPSDPILPPPPKPDKPLESQDLSSTDDTKPPTLEEEVSHA